MVPGGQAKPAQESDPKASGQDWPDEWSPTEHEAFLQALELHKSDWKKVASYVGTRTPHEVREHAQVHILTLSNKNEEGRQDQQQRPAGPQSSQPEAGEAGWPMSQTLVSPAPDSLKGLGILKGPGMGKDSMSPSSNESSHFRGMAQPTQMQLGSSNRQAQEQAEEAFLMNLATSGGMYGAMTSPPPRFMGSMQGLAPRALYQEDELLQQQQQQQRQQHGSYLPTSQPHMGSSQQRYANRLSMQVQGPHSPEMRQYRQHSESPRGSHPQPQQQQGGQMGGTHAIPEGSSPMLQARHSEEFGTPRMPHLPSGGGPGNMTRAASGPVSMQRQPSGMASPALQRQQSAAASLGPLHTGGARALTAETPPNLIMPRHLDTPDFAMIYAFLGSMFDPVCYMINHMDVLEQMKPVDRETAVLLMGNIVSNLDCQEFMDEYLHVLNNAGMGQHRHGGGYGPQ